MIFHGQDSGKKCTLTQWWFSPLALEEDPLSAAFDARSDQYRPEEETQASFNKPRQLSCNRQDLVNRYELVTTKYLTSAKTSTFFFKMPEMYRISPQSLHTPALTYSSSSRVRTVTPFCPDIFTIHSAPLTIPRIRPSENQTNSFN